MCIICDDDHGPLANLCAMTIVTNAMTNLAQNVTGLPNNGKPDGDDEG